MSTRLAIKASKLCFMDYNKSFIFCTFWSNRTSIRGERYLWTPFGLALSILNTNLFIASSTCPGMPATALQAMRSLRTRHATGPVSMFTGHTSATTWLGSTWKDASRFYSSSVGRRASSRALVPMRVVCWTWNGLWRDWQRRHLDALTLRTVLASGTFLSSLKIVS